MKSPRKRGFFCVRKNMDQYLELGKVNNTHGLRGEVKFEYWCDDIKYLKQLKKVYLDDEGKEALTLVNARPQKNIAILKLAEITDIEKAEALKGKVLYCDRDEADIEDGAFYLADVIGCFVVDDENGNVYGRITDVMNYGSCDIYEMSLQGMRFLLPATPDIIKKVDVEKQEIRIKPMKGLFHEN